VGPRPSLDNIEKWPFLTLPVQTTAVAQNAPCIPLTLTTVHIHAEMENTWNPVLMHNIQQIFEENVQTKHSLYPISLLGMVLIFLLFWGPNNLFTTAWTLLLYTTIATWKLCWNLPLHTKTTHHNLRSHFLHSNVSQLCEIKCSKWSFQYSTPRNDLVKNKSYIIHLLWFGQQTYRHHSW
jgi:hypothetical protein